MNDDDPLDLTQVAADEALLDGFRMRSIAAEDSAISLLRDLLADVDRDLPVDQPIGVGSTVLRLANESSPEPRLARNGTVVAVLTAGLVAFGGVAAASTAVSPSNPLHGLGEAVRSAAGAVVTAVTPPKSTDSRRPEVVLPERASDRATEVLANRPVRRTDVGSRALHVESDVGSPAASLARAAATARRAAAEAKADAARADAGKSDSGQPGGGKPDAGKPDAAATRKDPAVPAKASQRKAEPAAPADRPAPATADAVPDAARSAAPPDVARDGVEPRTTRSRGQLRQPSKLASTNPRA